MKLTTFHKVLIGLVILAILIPIAIYVIKFRGLTVSTKPADWGPFGDFFGGILNPLISLLTLIVTIVIAVELKKIEEQNNKKAIDSTYKPQLVIQQEPFYLYSSEYKGIIMPLEFSYEKKGFEYIANSERYGHPFTVNLYNIGLGATKKIRVSFDFAIDDAIKEITEMNNNVPTPHRIVIRHESKQHHDYLEIVGPNDNQMASFFDPNHVTEISYLLSANSSQSPFPLIIPPTILDLYRIYNFYWWEANQPNNKEWFPPFYVNLTYRDIGDNVTTKRFQIHFYFWSGSQQSSHHQTKVEEILLPEITA